MEICCLQAAVAGVGLALILWALSRMARGEFGRLAVNAQSEEGYGHLDEDLRVRREVNALSALRPGESTFRSRGLVFAGLALLIVAALLPKFF